MGDFSFNLVDEAWIPCLMMTGERQTVGLREVLSQAHQIEGFDLQSPLEEAALYRLLLALVHRVVDGPKNSSQWRDLYLAGVLDQGKIDHYLNTWHHRFDLFSDERPFYQTAGLQVLGKENEPLPLSVTAIQLARASGNNKTLFDHSRDAVIEPLSPMNAALSLLVAQGYLLGGLNKKTTNYFGHQESFLHGSMVTGLFCLLGGKNLCQTLALNLLVKTGSEPMPSTIEDSPVWERNEQEGTDVRTPRGYLDYLTCKSRHICLIPEVDGERNVVVSKVHMAQGESFQMANNPFGILRKNKKDERFPIQLDMTRSLWRDSAALFAFSPNADERPKAFSQVGNAVAQRVVAMPDRHRCIVYGLANDKANPLGWRKESLFFPTELLAEKRVVDLLRSGLSLVEEGGVVLESASKRYVRNCLPEDSRESDVQTGVNASGVMPIYWGRVELPYREFVAHVDRGDDAVIALKRAIKLCAREAFKSCFDHRMASSGKSYRAWVHGAGDLERGLAKRMGKGGDRS